MIFAPFFALLDAARRGTGQVLDAAGFGPIKTPSRIVFDVPGVRLRAYQPDGCPKGPVLLIIPAPIKRACIWDLLPEISVVRRCLRHGLRVYLLEWLDRESAQDDFGVADYTERLPLAVLDVVARETGEAAAMLAGHSLGGGDLCCAPSGPRVWPRVDRCAACLRAWSGRAAGARRDGRAKRAAAPRPGWWRLGARLTDGAAERGDGAGGFHTAAMGRPGR